MSLDSSRLVSLVKQAATEAVKAENPTAIRIGRVTSVSPLTVWVDQKLTLSAEWLELTSAVSNFSVDVTVNHSTETAEGHSHGISGKKTVTVNLGLSVGEQVLLIRADGGQKYIVLDRIRG